MSLKKRIGLITLPLVAVLVLIAGISGCVTANPAVSNPVAGSNPSAVSYVPSAAVSLYDENAVTALYDKAIPAVVEIQVVAQAPVNNLSPFQFNVPSQRGIGSGFFIDREGHILTNNHVVENAKTVTVTLHNGKRVDANVEGTDPQNDLALIKINTSDMNQINYLPMGNSDNIKPGQMAIAMGSPFGLEGSITVGIVSGVGRSLPGSANTRTIVNVIQTDAAINPGNSGGPLFNSRGEVVGINTAIEASGSNIGFAIPINTAKSRLPLLLKGGEAKSPWLGITGMAIDKELAAELGLATNSGVYIIAVTTGSPADKAGLKGSGSNAAGDPLTGGDIVIAIDNKTITKTEDILSHLNGKAPGDSVTLSVVRSDGKISIPVILGEWPRQLP